MKTVAIIGGGITGLVAAYYLKQAGLEVSLYESATRVGGVIQSFREEGFLAEAGPNTIMETDPRVARLVEDLGLTGKRIYTAPQAERRFIVRHGKPRQIPVSPAGFFRSSCFSWKAKLRLLIEPLIKRAPLGKEESLAQFVQRRLGQEFLDYAINPFVAGVYAGDPARLSVQEAFPKLYDLERRYGSLIAGQLLGARDRRKRGTISKQNARKFSFLSGLEDLTATLQRHLGAAVHLQHALKVLEKTSNGWNLTLSTPAGLCEREHDAVLLCAPAHQLAKILLIASGAPALEFLSRVTCAPVSTLALGFHRSQVRHPLDGFGFLLPEVEKMHILGCIFASSLFPNRAPKDHVLLTCYLGGLRSPSLPLSNKAVQVGLALHDLGNILGISGSPSYTKLIVHPRAIPQYELGYGRIREKARQLEQRCAGLYLAGNWRDGISLGDSILAGMAAVKKITQFIQIGGAPCSFPVAA